MAYTDIDKPSDHFETKLYTGTDGSLNITGLDFQPDFCWLKNRASGNRHALFDSVRGVTKRLRSDGTDTEVADPDTLTSFNSDGFTVGADAEAYGANNDGDAFVSWNWKAGTSFTNDASSTSIGSLDSSGSVNDTAGFAIVTYVGNGSSGATIKHGLTSAPTFMIIRVYDATAGFQVYSKAVGATKFAGYLNTTEAAGTTAGVVNNTDPGTSVFTVGNGGNTNNDGGNHIAYCFAEKQGFSKFGSYVGSGSAPGPFSYLGFKPAFLLMKEDGTDGWGLYDNKRNPSTTTSYLLQANDNGAESNAVANQIDFLSNGFKVCASGTQGNFINESGKTYVYMAFAENPLVTSTGIPGLAR